MRELLKANFHGRVTIAKPFKTEAKAKLPIRWCHDHNNWTLDDWKNVVYPDESS
jgi:hypothetical protein